MFRCRLLSCFCFVIMGFGALAQDPKSFIQYVDPFAGCEIGNTLVGPGNPFGMVKLGPDIMPPNNTTGYKLDKPIVGFSHNHLSGTGGGARYGNIMVIPQVGAVNIHDTLSIKYNEYAKPGYYTVTLGKEQGDVMAELTTTDHVGMHRYSFFVLDKPAVREAYIYGHKKSAAFDANILINVSSIINSKVYEVASCVGGLVNIVSDDQIEGYSEFSGGRGGTNPYKVYFVLKFDRPFRASGTWKDDKLLEKINTEAGKDIGAYVRFRLKQDEAVMVKVAISYASLKNAKINLKEITGWDFDKVRANSDALWNNYLSKIKVGGGTKA